LDSKIIDAIERIADIVKKNDLGAISFKSDKFTIEIEGKEPVAPIVMPAPVVQGAAPVMQAAVPATAAEPAAAEPAHTVSGNVVKSPIVGTFYDRADPKSAPFVKIGDTVKKGDTLFILESMKVMNHITSEYDGKIVEVFVQNGSPVEYEQPIMRIE
jgi:acetyl-CoA carboxylase biotin carboxyl carrier protein